MSRSRFTKVFMTKELLKYSNKKCHEENWSWWKMCPKCYRALVHVLSSFKTSSRVWFYIREAVEEECPEVYSISLSPEFNIEEIHLLIDKLLLNGALCILMHTVQRDGTGPYFSRANTHPSFNELLRKSHALKFEQRLEVVKLNKEYCCGPQLAHNLSCCVEQIYVFWNDPNLQLQQ